MDHVFSTYFFCKPDTQSLPTASTDHGHRVTDRTNLLDVTITNLFITETLRVNLDEPLPY